MKTLKLITLGLLLSGFSYGQDTIRKMVAGKNLNVFDLNNTHIVSSTDFYHEGTYIDYKINILENEVLLLHLYDDCKYCDPTIFFRELIIKTKDNKVLQKKVHSESNEYYFNGKEYNYVIVRKPS
jgi:hypothetical protein